MKLLLWLEADHLFSAPFDYDCCHGYMIIRFQFMCILCSSVCKATQFSDNFAGNMPPKKKKGKKKSKKPKISKEEKARVTVKCF